MNGHGDLDVDCAVIGAGIVGASCAYYLRNAGVDCALVDSGSAFSGASTNNAGGLHYQFSFTAMREGRQSFTRYLAIRDLNEDARERWVSLEAELDQELDLSMHGGVVVGETAEDIEQLRAKAELESAAQFGSVFLDRDELLSRCPELSREVQGGSWNPWEGHVNPRLVSGALMQRLAVDGCLIWENSRVTSLLRDSRGWHVRTERSSLRASSIVVAAGAWTSQVMRLLGLDLPMSVRPLTMSVSQKAPPTMTALVMHASRPLSVKQVRDGNIIVGGGRPALLGLRGEHWSSPAPHVPNLLINLGDAARVVPGIEGLPVLRSWQGVLGFPVDGQPVIGPVPGHRDAYVAVGGHTGWTIGPSCGWAVSNLVLGAGDPIRPELSPIRFRSEAA
jgi:glycine/D-amino acid oxidase-like deaminating enzyme